MWSICVNKEKTITTENWSIKFMMFQWKMFSSKQQVKKNRTVKAQPFRARDECGFSDSKGFGLKPEALDPSPSE